MCFLNAGLFHGKDIMFGNNISHSGRKTRRTWKPNVVSKRVWSDAMDDWVRFSMTTRAMKEIDNYGGIDNYLLRLDEASVQDSKYLTRIRDTIASKLFHKGELDAKLIKKLGYHKAPPANVETALQAK
jgi:large subunit ribosomal protein L28